MHNLYDTVSGSVLDPDGVDEDSKIVNVDPQLPQLWNTPDYILQERVSSLGYNNLSHKLTAVLILMDTVPSWRVIARGAPLVDLINIVNTPNASEERLELMVPILLKGPRSSIADLIIFRDEHSNKLSLRDKEAVHQLYLHSVPLDKGISNKFTAQLLAVGSRSSLRLIGTSASDYDIRKIMRSGKLPNRLLDTVRGGMRDAGRLRLLYETESATVEETYPREMWQELILHAHDPSTLRKLYSLSGTIADMLNSEYMLSELAKVITRESIPLHEYIPKPPTKSFIEFMAWYEANFYTERCPHDYEACLDIALRLDDADMVIKILKVLQYERIRVALTAIGEYKVKTGLALLRSGLINTDLHPVLAIAFGTVADIGEVDNRIGATALLGLLYTRKVEDENMTEAVLSLVSDRQHHERQPFRDVVRVIMGSVNNVIYPWTVKISTDLIDGKIINTVPMSTDINQILSLGTVYQASAYLPDTDEAEIRINNIPSWVDRDEVKFFLKELLAMPYGMQTIVKSDTTRFDTILTEIFNEGNVGEKLRDYLRV